MGRKRTERRPETRPPGRNGGKWRWVTAVAVLVLGAAATWFVWTFSASRIWQKRPLNVIVVTADTLRADRLSCYGYRRVTTPHLNGLADSGVLFENATTVTPLTLPAHASIFTGTYPMYHGVRDNGGYYLDAEQITLAEILNEQGYATGAFVAAFVLDSRWGLNQGFERYFDDFDLSKFEQVSLDSVQRPGGEVLAEALTWMESVKDRRFFSWIHFYDPHTPYDPPEPFRSRYEGTRWGLYDGEVAYLDSLVGELLKWVADKNLGESTIIVFIGDHGESLGEHKETAHGFFIYDVTVRVPFILRVPHRGFQGRRTRAQVRTIDLVPTLLDLLGLEIPDQVQGQSLMALMSGEDDSLDLVAYSESLYPQHHYGWSELKSLRNEAFHYIAAPRAELFDIRADPLELNNIVSNRPEVVEDFERRLEQILDLYSAEGIEDKQPQSLDPETQAQLAALGYLGGPSKVKVDPTAELADPKDKIDLFNLIRQAGSDSTEGKYDEALGKIRRVLDQDPNVVEAYHILGNLHKKQGDRDLALAAYKEALSRDHEYKPAVFNLAVTYEEMGRWEEAETGFRRVLELDPRDNRAMYMLAVVHAHRDEFREALEILSKSTALGIARAPAYNLMAECHIELKEFDQAQALVNQALEINDELPSAHYNLALILEGRGDLQGAIREYEREIEISPKNYKSHFNLAKLLGAVRRFDQQMTHFQKSIELNENFAEGHLYLARMYLDRGDFEQALALANKGIDLGPERSIAPLGHYVLADVYNRLGRFQEAERQVKIAESLQRF